MATPATQAANGGLETKRKRRARKRKEREEREREEEFFSPVGSPVAPPPQQRRKAQPGLPQAAEQQHVQQPRSNAQQQQHANQAAAPGSTPTRLPMRGKRVSPHRRATVAEASAELGAPEASGAAVTAAAQAGAQPPAQPAPSGQEDQRRAQVSSPAAAVKPEGKRRRRKNGRKTLTAKGKRAAVLGVLAEAEVAKIADAGGAAAPQGSRGDDASGQRQQQQQEAQPAGPAAQPSAPAAASPAAPASDPAATANLGRAWSKADIATLARLAEDRAFLVQTVAGHPADGELDWELISRHFGRYSRGGVAVRQQYYSVVRLMKAARHEGRKGASYVDLVCSALRTLAGRQGSIFDVQAVLKRDHSRCLDKYRVKGVLRWKTAVREVLTDNPELFEQAGKTPTGKILWRLWEAA